MTMKRALDIAISLILLILASPILALAALAIKLDSPGPVFYAARRVGRNGVEFRMYKFRSMYIDADRRGPLITSGVDPRVTRVGRMLRQTKIDELPQLWNVLWGDMSLVGPRPESPCYVAHYTEEQRAVLALRPGITGPAQIAYCDLEDVLDPRRPEEDYIERVLPVKLAINLAYLETQSLGGDLKILLQTAIAVPIKALTRRTVIAVQTAIMSGEAAARAAVRHLLPLLPLQDWYASGGAGPGRQALVAVAPLLDYGVGGEAEVPPAARVEWAAVRRGTAFRSLLAEAEEARVLRALHEAGVPTIVLKGAALKETTYPAYGLRPMSDLDILVRPRDAERAAAVLRAQGFEPVQSGERDSADHTELDADQHFVRWDGARSLEVDIHTHLLSVRRYHASFGGLEMEPLWERARPATVAGVPCLALGPEDQLLHCCVHASIHHPFSNLVSYVDAHLLATTTEGLDWQGFVARARSGGVRAAAYAALLATRNLLGTSIPEVVLRALKPPVWSRRVIERLCDPRRMIRPDGIGLDLHEQEVARVLVSDSIRAAWAGLRTTVALEALGEAQRSRARSFLVTARAAAAAWHLGR